MHVLDLTLFYIKTSFHTDEMRVLSKCLLNIGRHEALTIYLESLF